MAVVCFVSFFRALCALYVLSSFYYFYLFIFPSILSASCSSMHFVVHMFMFFFDCRALNFQTFYLSLQRHCMHHAFFYFSLWGVFSMDKNTVNLSNEDHALLINLV